MNKYYLYDMNYITVKNCSTCGTPFNCGAMLQETPCWCSTFPPIFAPSATVNCLCSACFTTACTAKIDEYVATITPENATDNIAKALPQTNHLIEGIDYYLQNGNYVFKAWFHLKRGYCCTNGCRHCPYGFKQI